ncbi:Type I restriction enzyme EcoKI specificity protein [Edwardsiella tarda]|uniref:Restriction endonuclease subunit S n=1 Tax=Edwardsiella tarda ATCC 15947 = NBRC 105688 TaxID=667121 RepID=A0AC61TJ30_EDWTA|nr:restriction endonuclease subunit S [Edwardsiella tarda]UAL56316.1 restriction endonuclease subunit S [Edwardsiella tarda]UCQ00625.1 restriction endonuclease subunit S [Edwardsiella tarda ATCC 15947 = NBRC 105688]STD28230.1 Type I restriction enzyme EcoKI specificity protein [Edwardsiella tarda]
MSGGKLPEGWAIAPVSTVTTLIRGVTYKKEQAINYLQDDYLPLIRANNIQNGKFDTTDLVFVPKNLVKESQKISPEDIVIAMSSGSKSVVGKSAHQRLPFECSFGAFCGALRPEKCISPSFIAHFTKSSFYRNKISSLSAGANINNIKPASFDLINIPIPALAEQKIIAEKLDTLLAQVDSTKARLEQIPQILKRFRQAVLVSAVNGKLQAEPANNKNCTIGSLCLTSFDGPFGSKLKTSDYTDSGVRVVRLENIGHLEFKSAKETFISYVKYENLYSNTLKEDDLLFSSFVDEDVRVCLVPKSDEIFINKADCFCLRIDPSLASPHYLALVLASKTSYEQIKEKVQGITRPRINLRTLRSLSFDIPPLKKQHEIVRRVEQLFAYADTIEKQVNSALTRVNSLTQSILAKAFRGELTAQWRAENPDLISGENSAAALLEKIKAERAASGGKKASRKKA